MCIEARKSRNGELGGGGGGGGGVESEVEDEDEDEGAGCDWLAMMGYRAKKLTVVHYMERAGVRHV